MKRNFEITITDLATGKTMTAELAYDPLDIYDAALGSIMRGRARDLLGLSLDAPQLGVKA